MKPFCKRLLLLFPLLAIGSAFSDESSAFSAVVSYQFRDTIDSGDIPSEIFSPLAGFQYLQSVVDFGSATSDTQSELISFQYQQVALHNVSLRSSSQSQAAAVSFAVPTDLGVSFYLKFKQRLTDRVWKLIRIIMGDGKPKGFEELINPTDPEGYYVVETGSDRFMQFPLAKSLGTTPYTAAVSAVLDHTMPFGNRANGVVTAFTGDNGTEENGRSVWSTVNDKESGDVLYGFAKNKEHSPFSFSINYTGGAEGATFLFYDGHTGYDYLANEQTKVYAAAEGMAEQGDFGGSTGLDVRINHANGYTTYYVELGSNTIGSAPRHVDAGEDIGTVGKKHHLHLTVKIGSLRVDPYGWKGRGPDPLGVNGINNKCLWIECDDSANQ